MGLRIQAWKKRTRSVNDWVCVCVRVGVERERKRKRVNEVLRRPEFDSDSASYTSIFLKLYITFSFKAGAIFTIKDWEKLEFFKLPYGQQAWGIFVVYHASALWYDINTAQSDVWLQDIPQCLIYMLMFAEAVIKESFAAEDYTSGTSLFFNNWTNRCT